MCGVRESSVLSTLGGGLGWHSCLSQGCEFFTLLRDVVMPMYICSVDPPYVSDQELCRGKGCASIPSNALSIHFNPDLKCPCFCSLGSLGCQQCKLPCWEWSYCDVEQTTQERDMDAATDEVTKLLCDLELGFEAMLSKRERSVCLSFVQM